MCAEVADEILDLLGIRKSEHKVEYGLYEVFGDIGNSFIISLY